MFKQLLRLKDRHIQVNANVRIILEPFMAGEMVYPVIYVNITPG